MDATAETQALRCVAPLVTFTAQYLNSEFAKRIQHWIVSMFAAAS
jgi:hypothetical protein